MDEVSIQIGGIHRSRGWGREKEERESVSVSGSKNFNANVHVGEKKAREQAFQ